MASNINDCKELLEYRATKAGYNGNLSPNDFNRIFPSAERRYFNQLYKVYGINQDNVDSLTKFKSDPTTITVDNEGKYIKPNDLLHIDSIRHTINNVEVPITKVNDDRLGSYLTSTYDAPDLNFPIYVDYNTYIQFYPKNLSSAQLVYLKDLTPSKWGYTLNGSGRPVYDPTTSTQPNWSNADIDEIIALCGVDLGVNMRDTFLYQTQDKLAKENT